MKDKIIKYAKNNPQKMASLIHTYNYFFGHNRIRIHKDNNINIGSVLIKKTKITVKGVNNTVIIKDLARITNCNIRIVGNNNKIFIDEKAFLRHSELWIEDNENEISIGRNTTMHADTHLSAIEGTSIKIGENCMFSSGILIRTGDSHSIVNSNGERINKSQNIEIGDHVWFGINVLCLKGTHIANNSIVGAGSLLTKGFNEENVAIAGNPAKIIKNNVNWDRQRL